MKLYQLSRLILLLALFLAACDPTVTPLPTLPPLPSATVPSPTFTATNTPFHPSTPTPPRRGRVTPVETLTAAPLPSLTKMIMPTLTLAPTATLYVFPVQPASRATYGEGTEGHGYPATDIFAAEGTKYVAVIAGVVDYVSDVDQWNPEKPDPAARGGLSVAIIGIDGIRYYGSHLSEIADGIFVGAKVKTGQVLGYVGASGDAKGTPTHVHFGISLPSFPEDWQARRGQLDPFPYLNAWKDGINMRPVFP
jgi:peptidoglycan LD-endopeptidase LytH